MGVVVAMTPRADARPAARTEGSAEILFFTGVRYYRLPEDVQAAIAAATPKRRRATKAKPTTTTRRHG